MEKTRRITIILVMAVAFCFVLVSLAQAGKLKKDPIWGICQEGTDKPVKWEKHKPNPRFAIYDHMGNNNEWDDDEYNDEADLTAFVDDLVLDRETGLVWTRDANIREAMPDKSKVQVWEQAMSQCSLIKHGNHMGWRPPALVELASLIDPSQVDPALPIGHPFINVQPYLYWTKSHHKDFTTDNVFDKVRCVAFKPWAYNAEAPDMTITGPVTIDIEYLLGKPGNPVLPFPESLEPMQIWPVRGGTASP